MKVLLPLLASVLLTGCYSITKYPDLELPTITKSTTTTVKVYVQWHESVDSITKACSDNKNILIYGCAVSFTSKENSICIIHAMEPKNFSDAPKLAILGHEFWHCLGARHQ